VKRCGKSAPASGATRAARQPPLGARPKRGTTGPVTCPLVGRTDGWSPSRTPARDRWTESRLQAGSPSPPALTRTRGATPTTMVPFAVDLREQRRWVAFTTTPRIRNVGFANGLQATLNEAYSDWSTAVTALMEEVSRAMGGLRPAPEAWRTSGRSQRWKHSIARAEEIPPPVSEREHASGPRSPRRQPRPEAYKQGPWHRSHVGNVRLGWSRRSHRTVISKAVSRLRRSRRHGRRRGRPRGRCRRAALHRPR
jgi:hypothetical protein